MDRPKELLKPVKFRYVVLSIVIALLLELLPFNRGTVRWIPDLAAMVVLYWTINRPTRFGIFAGFFTGLLTDIASASLLGQHALAYSVSAYAVESRQRQVVMYNLGQQSLIVFGLLMANQIVMLVARMALGAPFIGWGFFFSPFVGALLWPLLTNLLLVPQRYHQAG